MHIPAYKVQEVIERFLRGELKTEISRRMGISRFQVTKIIAGNARKEVGRPQELGAPEDKILLEHQGEILRLIRISLGMSQGELGRELGIDYATISRWENDLWKMNPSRRRAFLNYLREKRILAMVTDFQPLRKEGYSILEGSPRGMSVPGPSSPEGICESLDEIDQILEEGDPHASQI